MTVNHVEVLVEEPSMQAAMQRLLPRLLGETTFKVYAFRCKQDLLKRLPERLWGYSKWLPSDWRILVIVDRDNDNCLELKEKMETVASDASLVTKTQADDSISYHVVNRVAVEELEAWYFGDWQAVRRAYPRVSESVPRRARYRKPDEIKGETWEAFERLLKRSGYFRNGLRKIEAARKVAKHWNPEANKSHSFQVLRKTLCDMASA